MKRGRQKTGENAQTTIAAIAATILAMVTLGVAVFCWWLRILASTVPPEERAREEAKGGLEGLS